ncbi:MAG: hypothetical protein KJ077_10950 [Anaerolineae bacterium]|nr:hypothetical protein [Anaerolineae bacterium]
MSDTQKTRLSLGAAAKTRSDYERHAWKLLAVTDCPCICVVASSGGPSTENSYLCSFVVADVPALQTWHPFCNGRLVGKVHTCALLAYLYKRFKACQEAGDVEALKAINQKMRKLRLIQVSRKLYERRVDGGIGWYEYVEPELTQVGTQLPLKHIV